MEGSLMRGEIEEGIETEIGIGETGVIETEGKEMETEGLAAGGKTEMTGGIEIEEIEGEMGTEGGMKGEGHPDLVEMMTEETGGILDGEEMKRGEIETETGTEGMAGGEMREMGERMLVAGFRVWQKEEDLCLC